MTDDQAKRASDQSSPEVNQGAADPTLVEHADDIAKIAAEAFDKPSGNAGPSPEIARDEQLAARDRRAGETSDAGPAADTDPTARPNHFEGFDAGRILTQGIAEESGLARPGEVVAAASGGSASAEHHRPRAEAGHPSPTGPEQRGTDLATPSAVVKETGSDEVVRSPIDDNPEKAVQPEAQVVAAAETPQEPEQDTASPEDRRYKEDIERGAKDLERSLTDMIKRAEEYREQLIQSAHDARTLVLSALGRFEGMNGANEELRERIEVIRQDVAETESVLNGAKAAYEQQLAGTKKYVAENISREKIIEAIAADDSYASGRVLSETARTAGDISEDYYRSSQKIIDEIGLLSNAFETRARSIEDEDIKRASYIVLESLDQQRLMTSRLRNALSDVLAGEALQIRKEATNLAELAERKPQRDENRTVSSSSRSVDDAPVDTL